MPRKIPFFHSNCCIVGLVVAIYTFAFAGEIQQQQKKRVLCVSKRLSSKLLQKGREFCLLVCLGIMCQILVGLFVEVEIMTLLPNLLCIKKILTIKSQFDQYEILL